mgnify:CR=1 FL=1
MGHKGPRVGRRRGKRSSTCKTRKREATLKREEVRNRSQRGGCSQEKGMGGWISPLSCVHSLRRAVPSIARGAHSDGGSDAAPRSARRGSRRERIEAGSGTDSEASVHSVFRCSKRPKADRLKPVWSTYVHHLLGRTKVNGFMMSSFSHRFACLSEDSLRFHPYCGRRIVKRC